MKIIRIVYWVTTGIISALMFFSAYSYFANPQIAEGFKHLGFPDYFRVELAIAKALGGIVLIVPQIPGRVKEWAYAGFGITFISAANAHFQSADPISSVVTPLIVFGILIVSYVFSHKQK